MNFTDPFGLCPFFLTGKPCSFATAVGVGLFPVIGDAIEIIGAGLGKDLLTGERIGGVGVGATLLGAVVGSGKLARHGADVAQQVVKGNLKTLTSGRIRNLGIDAEALKAGIVGRAGGEFNLAADKAGAVFLTPVRRGSRELIPTGYTLDELGELFPRGR